MPRNLSLFLAITGAMAGLSTAAQATVLTFDRDGGGLVSAADLATYGDDVAASPQGGFSYGVGAEGFTPDVQASFGQGATPFADNYGDLTNVVFDSGGDLQLTLSAASGFEVLLHEFQLAGWPTADYTISSVSVTDGGGASLFSDNLVLIQGDGSGPGHSTFSFGVPLAAETLVIAFNSNNLLGGRDNIGVDNIRFGQAQAQQQPIPTPAPASFGLIALGLAGLASSRLRRNRKNGV